MSRDDEHRSGNEALPMDLSTALAGAHAPMAMAPEQEMRLRRRILDRVARERREVPQFLTLRADEGEWVDLAPGIRKKSLFTDHSAGTESFLLSVDPGTEAPPHRHRGTELCLVLEGSVQFGSLHLSAGDWHVARGGSEHARGFSETGALLFIQEPARNEVPPT